MAAAGRLQTSRTRLPSRWWLELRFRAVQRTRAEGRGRKARGAANLPLAPHLQAVPTPAPPAPRVTTACAFLPGPRSARLPAAAVRPRAHRSPAPGSSPRGYGRTGPSFQERESVALNGRLKVTPRKDPPQDSVPLPRSGFLFPRRSKIFRCPTIFSESSWPGHFLQSQRTKWI